MTLANPEVQDILNNCPVALREGVEERLAAFVRLLDAEDRAEAQARIVDHSRVLVEQAKAEFENRVRQSLRIDEFLVRTAEKRGREHFIELTKQITQERLDAKAADAEREALWKKQETVRQGDVLLIKVTHPDGHVIWKVPASAEEFVKSALPVFAKRLESVEPQEASELRELQRNLRLNRWRMRKPERESLESQIEDTRARLERGKRRTPLPRYGIFKTLAGRDVGVHRLYLRCRDEEVCSSFNGDMCDFTDVGVRYRVKRNFGLTSDQIAKNVPEKLAKQYEERVTCNLYIVSGDNNPSKARSQSDYERDGILVLTDNENFVEGQHIPIQPNADLGKQAQCFGRLVDCGKFLPERGDAMLHEPKVTARMKRAGKALDALMKGE
jgi:hypothetical protein